MCGSQGFGDAGSFVCIGNLSSKSESDLSYLYRSNGSGLGLALSSVCEPVKRTVRYQVRLSDLTCSYAQTVSSSSTPGSRAGACLQFFQLQVEGFTRWQYSINTVNISLNYLVPELPADNLPAL